jgi:hypothetical protein
MIGGNNVSERARNRDKILQIHDFCKTSKEKLNNLLTVDEEEGYDEEK